MGLWIGYRRVRHRTVGLKLIEVRLIVPVIVNVSRIGDVQLKITGRYRLLQFMRGDAERVVRHRYDGRPGHVIAAGFDGECTGIPCIRLACRTRMVQYELAH
ncbi:hypothetical protein D3C76_1062590 [compost metagenome]